MSDDKLTYEIISYIFSSFGIGKNNISYKINDNKFKTSATLDFDEDGVEIKRDIFCCQISNDDFNLCHAFIDVSFEEKEYIVLTCLNERSFIASLFIPNNLEKTKMLYSYSGDNWSNMTLLAKANYLSGLEQIKQSSHTYSKFDNDISNIVSACKSLYDYLYNQQETYEDKTVSLNDVVLSENIGKL